MTSQRWMLPLLILGSSAIALVPAARLSKQESLKSALDAVARKQRSLDTADSPEYYNDLHSFKYHGGDADRKFDRDFDADDEEIEFLPGNGQLETVGGGLQDLDNKLLQRALIDYLEEELAVPEEPVASNFRERERGGSRKRGGAGDRSNLDDKDLARLFVEELQDGSPYGPLDEMDDNEYLTALQTLYDRYRAGRGNKVYETAGPMSWGELLSKDQLLRSQTKGSDDKLAELDQDQQILYLPSAERRSNYFMGREVGSYRLPPSKRYPVAKRSPKTSQNKLKTDPKVAQDLGALFGTQSADAHNHTHKSDHDHDHEHIHDAEHDHDHDHDHDHNHESSSEMPPKATLSPKGQKENATKTTKSKFIQVRKKSVDWSQYFGIDRRKKKATFVAGQGSQNQNDEWMLQRYYENMAENLKSNDENETKEKLEQMDSKLKYIKDLIIEEALRYANLEDEADMQKVKDKLMSRMVTAYSLQKMRKALNDLRNNMESVKEAQKEETQNNLTSSFRENSHNNGNSNSNSGGAAIRTDKRSGINNNIDDGESLEEPRSCPELETIEWRCKAVDNLVGDISRMLYVPCVKLQICKACAQDEEGLLPCLANYAVEASKVCDTLDSKEGQAAPRLAMAREEERQSCANAALLLSQLKPPAAASVQCRTQNTRESCLRRYNARYEHRYFRTSSAYESPGHRPHHAGALDALQQSMSER